MNQWTDYRSYGWQLCELRPGTKAPLAKNWTDKGCPFNENALAAGLVHEHSGTCAIDIDNYEEAEKWLGSQGISLSALLSMPDSLKIFSGRANRAKLLYRITTPLPTFKVAPYEAGGKRWKALELRCKGGQDVLPPSIHPDTSKPYEWVGEPLLGVPPLPAALQVLWEALAAPAAERQAAPAVPVAASVDDISAMLESRDPDMPYDNWVRVGMAIHSATNGKGVHLFDSWSRRGEKYKGTADIMSHWSSFRAAGGVGIGTLLEEVVATPGQFPLETTVDEFTGSDEDQTPAGIAQRILQPRLILLTGQGRYFFQSATPEIDNLDRHGEVLLPNDATVNNLFTRHMPEMVNPKTGARTRRPPTDFMRNGCAQPQIAYNMGFHPGAGRMFRDGVDGRSYLNRFQPTTIESLKPTASEMDAWEWLMARVQDDHFRRWMMQFYAHMLKHPGVKIQSAPLLYSQMPGTGKSTLMKLIPKLLFGSRWVRTVSNDEINSRFTGFLADSWVVVLDELRTSGAKMDRVNLANKMKPWITEAELPIERKGENAYSITNRLQITATSNYDDAVQIDDDDRRWGICEMTGKTFSAAEKADLYGGLLNTDRAPGVLKYIFEHVDLTGFNPAGEAPRTSGRSAMVSSGLGTIESDIVEAIDAGMAPFDRDVVRLDDARNLLHGSFKPSLKKMAGILKRPPFNSSLIHAGSVRLYCWRNQEGWSTSGPAATLRYLETGERPPGDWDLTVPLAIRTMAGDDDEPVDPITSLLGNVNG